MKSEQPKPIICLTRSPSEFELETANAKKRTEDVGNYQRFASRFFYVEISFIVFWVILAPLVTLIWMIVRIFTLKE